MGDLVGRLIQGIIGITIWIIGIRRGLCRAGPKKLPKLWSRKTVPLASTPDPSTSSLDIEAHCVNGNVGEVANPF